MTDKLDEIIERLRKHGSSAGDAASETTTSAVVAATSTRAKLTYAGLLVLFIAVGLFVLSWKLAGPIPTVIYSVLFLFALTLIPTMILLLGPSFPNSIRGMMGRLNFIMGQVAYDGSYLVQLDDTYELCPGTDEHVYVNGAWREIAAGHENRTILGWKPFGIILYKEDKTLQDARVDPAAVDGGTNSTGNKTTRGGYAEQPPDPSISGIDGAWLVDLKQVYSRGIQQIGDISLIEKAEEVTMRTEAKKSRIGGWEPVIGSIVGLILGVLTGYVMLGGV